MNKKYDDNSFWTKPISRYAGIVFAVGVIMTLVLLAVMRDPGVLILGYIVTVIIAFIVQEIIEKADKQKSTDNM